MKNLFKLPFFYCLLFSFQTILAQEPVALLEHGNSTKAFYGQDAFVIAYNASTNGDKIYLSAGSFNSPDAITHSLKIYGAGHFPVENQQTKLLNLLNLSKGSDGLRLEGLYIDGGIVLDGTTTINNVKIIRCKANYIDFQAKSPTESKNNCSIEECFILGSVSFQNHGENLWIRNSVIEGGVGNIQKKAIIEGNIFLEPGTGASATIYNVHNSIIRNNIFLNMSSYIFRVCTGNTVTKNLFTWTPNISGNYDFISQYDIFISQSGNNINYQHNYHLQSPEKYIGNDGKQVGIYGGLGFKENGATSTPAITQKDIDSSTDINSNLKINISVTAQDSVNNQIVAYRYWFDDQFSSNIEKTVTPSNPLTLSNMLIKTHVPVQANSSAYTFIPNSDIKITNYTNSSSFYFQAKDRNALWSSVVASKFSYQQTDTVICRKLTSGVPYSQKLESKDTIHFYSVNAKNKDSLVFQLDKELFIDLYDSSGKLIKTISSASATTPQGLSITKDGEYYALVRGFSSALSGTYNITYTQISQFYLLSYNNKIVGNKTPATITFRGNGFSNSTNVVLQQGAETIIPTSVKSLNPGILETRFNFNGFEKGFYSIKLDFGDSTILVPNGVEVSPDIYAELIPGVSVQKTIPEPDVTHFYRFRAGLGDSLSFRIMSLISSGNFSFRIKTPVNINVYDQYGILVQSFSKESATTTDGFKAPANGIFYVCLEEFGTDVSGNYTLDFNLTPRYCVQSYDKKTVSNKTTGSIVFTGNGFDNNTSISLKKNNFSIAPVSIKLLNETKLEASFSYLNAPLGFYDIYVDFTDTTIVIKNGLEVSDQTFTVLSGEIKMERKGDYPFAGIYEYDNLELENGTTLYSYGISQLVINVRGTLTLGSNVNIIVRNGFSGYAGPPTVAISSINSANVQNYNIGTDNNYLVLPSVYGKGGNGGDGGDGGNGIVETIGAGFLAKREGCGGNGGHGGGGGFGGGKGGEKGYKGYKANFSSADIKGYNGNDGSVGNDNGRNGGGSPGGIGGLDIGVGGTGRMDNSEGGSGGGGNGGFGGDGGDNILYLDNGNVWIGNGGNGGGGGGGGYGGGVLIITANEIVFKGAGQHFFVNGQKGGLKGNGGNGSIGIDGKDGSNGQNGEGGLLIINCPDFPTNKTELWNLNSNTSGYLDGPYKGHGIITGNPQKVLFNVSKTDPRLKLSDTNITLPGKSENPVTITLTSNVKWKAVSDKSWLKITPASGDGNSTLVLTAENNTGTINRTATITISADGITTQVVTVTQETGLSTGIQSIETGTITLYPNPACEGFSIGGLQNNASLRIFDMSGRMLFEKEITGGEYIPVEFLSPGVYIVAISGSNLNVEKRLIKK